MADKNFNFKTSCDHILKQLCGKKDNSLGAYEFKLETIAGPLHCESKEDWLACVFTDVNEAKKKIQTGSLNPYSGKWNWMFTNPDEISLKGLFKEMAVVMDVSDSDLIEYYIKDKEALGTEEDLNTKITFMYRDGSNYKQTKEVTFSGVVGATEDLNVLIFSCDTSDGNNYFIPGQVDLEDLQGTMGGGQWDPDIDHPWHQIIAITPVLESESSSNDERSIDDFIDAMSSFAISGWNENHKPLDYPVVNHPALNGEA